jgi:hypothetical protein
VGSGSAPFPFPHLRMFLGFLILCFWNQFRWWGQALPFLSSLARMFPWGFFLILCFGISLVWGQDPRSLSLSSLACLQV